MEVKVLDDHVIEIYDKVLQIKNKFLSIQRSELF